MEEFFEVPLVLDRNEPEAQELECHDQPDAPDDEGMRAIGVCHRDRVREIPGIGPGRPLISELWIS